MIGVFEYKNVKLGDFYDFDYDLDFSYENTDPSLTFKVDITTSGVYYVSESGNCIAIKEK